MIETMISRLNPKTANLEHINGIPDFSTDEILAILALIEQEEPIGTKTLTYRVADHVREIPKIEPLLYNRVAERGLEHGYPEKLARIIAPIVLLVGLGIPLPGQLTKLRRLWIAGGRGTSLARAEYYSAKKHVAAGRVHECYRELCYKALKDRAHELAQRSTKCPTCNGTGQVKLKQCQHCTDGFHVPTDQHVKKEIVKRIDLDKAGLHWDQVYAFYRWALEHFYNCEANAIRLLIAQIKMEFRDK